MPNPLNFDPTCYDNPHGVNSGTPPWFDDGIALATPNSVSNAAANGNTPNEPSASRVVFTANHAALAVGGTSVAAEGAGTETLFTQTYSANVLAPIPLTTTGTGPNATAATILAGPNASHASSLSPSTNPTLASIAPTTSVHGTAAITMTATGVGFTRQSKIVIGGVPQNTTFVSLDLADLSGDAGRQRRHHAGHRRHRRRRHHRPSDLDLLMSIESINEPGNSRLTMLHPPSINEPPEPAIGDGDFEVTPPRATGMDPLSCAIGDPPLTLTVTGTDFTDQTLIVFDQVPSVTAFVSDTELTLELEPGGFH